MSTSTEKQDTGQHRPGPWWASQIGDAFGNWEVLAQDGPDDAVAVATVHEESDADAEANARLMAAAPDGLDAARFALSVLRTNPVEQSERLAIEKLEAFIAKATGEQP